MLKQLNEYYVYFSFERPFSSSICKSFSDTVYFSVHVSIRVPVRDSIYFSIFNSIQLSVKKKVKKC